MNSECKHYYEDHCMHILEKDTISVSEEGTCKTYEKGRHESYEDDMTKYECSMCHRQFILGDAAVKELTDSLPHCSYCGSEEIEWIAKAKAGEIEDMGCMEIWTTN